MPSDQKLVLDPVDGGYVLPQPPRGHGEVIVVGGAQGRRASLRRGQHVARAFGQRMVAQADGLQSLLGEVRGRLAGLDQSIAEDSRAQLKGAVRELTAVVEWCSAVQSDLQQEGERALDGCEPIDVVQLCRDLAAEHEDPAMPVSVQAPTHATWWGRAMELAELIDGALMLVAERTQGSGARHVDVACDGGTVVVGVRSFGEPMDAVESQSVQRFRRAADELGVVVTPDFMGPGGAGMLLRLPS